MIPPRHNADFVAHMEDVLEVYKRPLDEKYPVVCMDEQPQQLIAETRRSIPARGGRVEHYDYEYERCGTAALFLLVQPLAAWRKVNVRKQRTSKTIERLIPDLPPGQYVDDIGPPAGQKHTVNKRTGGQAPQIRTIKVFPQSNRCTHGKPPCPFAPLIQTFARLGIPL